MFKGSISLTMILQLAFFFNGDLLQCCTYRSRISQMATDSLSMRKRGQMIIGGSILLFISGFLWCYLSFTFRMRRVEQPLIWDNAIAVFGLNFLWFGLFAGGLVLLFLESWVAGLIVLPLYFFVLPVIQGPLLRRLGFL